MDGSIAEMKAYLMDALTSKADLKDCCLEHQIEKVGCSAQTKVQTNAGLMADSIFDIRWMT